MKPSPGGSAPLSHEDSNIWYHVISRFPAIVRGAPGSLGPLHLRGFPALWNASKAQDLFDATLMLRAQGLWRGGLRRSRPNMPPYKGPLSIASYTGDQVVVMGGDIRSCG